MLALLLIHLNTCILWDRCCSHDFQSTPYYNSYVEEVLVYFCHLVYLKYSKDSKIILHLDAKVILHLGANNILQPRKPWYGKDKLWFLYLITIVEELCRSPRKYFDFTAHFCDKLRDQNYHFLHVRVCFLQEVTEPEIFISKCYSSMKFHHWSDQYLLYIIIILKS